MTTRRTFLSGSVCRRQVGSWTVAVCRSNADAFNVVGVQWVRLVDGLSLYVGIGHVLMFTVAWWRAERVPLANRGGTLVTHRDY
jgi:hypothetical protein